MEDPPPPPPDSPTTGEVVAEGLVQGTSADGFGDSSWPKQQLGQNQSGEASVFDRRLAPAIRVALRDDRCDFVSLLRTFAKLKRPVSTSIEALDESEKVLFYEFVDVTHATLKSLEIVSPDEARAMLDKPTKLLVHKVLDLANVLYDDCLLDIQTQILASDKLVQTLKEDFEKTLPMPTVDNAPAPKTSTNATTGTDTSLVADSSDGKNQNSAGGKRKRENLNASAVDVLKAWFKQNLRRPYPSEQEKHQLAAQANVTVSQVTNWLINSRKRIWKSMLEDEVGPEEAKKIMSQRAVGASHFEPLHVPCLPGVNIIPKSSKRRKSMQEADDPSEAVLQVPKNDATTNVLNSGNSGLQHMHSNVLDSGDASSMTNVAQATAKAQQLGVDVTVGSIPESSAVSSNGSTSASRRSARGSRTPASARKDDTEASQL